MSTTKVFEIKGEQLAELSKLVKRVGDQQKELIIDISKQLSKHNEMMEKALDKQSRMEQKLLTIEETIKNKPEIGY